MKNDLENSEWMNEAPHLAGLSVKHPFSIPEGYFEGLPSDIHEAIFLDGLKTDSPTSGFKTPEGYFDSLSTKIQAEVVGYTVPQDYFQQLQQKIAAKTTNEKVAKTIRLWHSKALKYASAACFVLISGLGVYFYQNNNHPPMLSADAATEQMLFDIDENTIIDHIQANSLSQEHPSVPEADLENYILSNYSQNDIASDL
ncbi:hypothetical protein [Pedobacter gandavensis]|uniref:Uncharacterized protein n=1 Tax=Pedobacter gandavensis TaxID=2679963 RepID=A0ABR6EVT7_9SPHI|nr:hypothetical protein [Pedobacter gandavensis]MBB2149390.1 hypothetical protein [Pedobacter gandavensis]